MPALSVILITHNEARNIRSALESVRWADEIVVIDSGSTDETVAIASGYTERVSVQQWPGYAAQKNAAAAAARHDWVLSIDADERVSPALAEEIQRLLIREPRACGYRIPRVTSHLGRWIRSTDWYPDYQLRLYDRRVARWRERRVHESVVVDGPVATLRSELLHHPYRNISHHLQTIDRYSTLAALELHHSGRRAGPLDVLVRPPVTFLRNYILRAGIRDGMPGLIVSMANSFYVLAKFAKLWELGSNPKSPIPDPQSQILNPHPESPPPNP